jgi:hypothetical protein
VQLVALTVLLPLCLLRDFRFLTPVVKVPRARPLPRPPPPFPVLTGQVSSPPVLTGQVSSPPY